jgi:hypothetical protein
VVIIAYPIIDLAIVSLFINAMLGAFLSISVLKILSSLSKYLLGLNNIIYSSTLVWSINNLHKNNYIENIAKYL